MSRTARSIFTYISGAAVAAVTLGMGLIAAPLLLRWLGAERLGAHRAAMDWLGHLSLFEMGVAGSVAPLAARALGRGRPAELEAVMMATIALYRRLVVLMLLGAVALLALITWLVPVSPSLRPELRMGTSLVAAGLLTVPLTPFRILLEAEQRGYVIQVLLAVQAIVATALALMFARQGLGITGQCLAGLAGTLALNGLLLWHVRRRHPRLFHRRRAAPTAPAGDAADYGRELRRLNWPTWAFNLSGRLGLFTDNIVIAAVIGPAAVVPFLMTQRLAQIAVGQLQSIGSSAWAAQAELHARGEAARFNDRLIDLTQLTTALGMTTLIPILVFNEPFVALWVGPGQFAGRWVSMLAVTNALLLAIASLWGWMFSGTGKIATLVPVSLLGSVVNLTVSVGVTWGLKNVAPAVALAGPLIGSAIGLLTVSCAWARLLRERFGVPLRALLSSVAIPLSAGSVYGSIVWWVAARYPVHTWVGLAMAMTSCASGCLLMVWRVILRPDERRAWSQRFQNVVWSRDERDSAARAQAATDPRNPP